jgi:hypothetical protein
MKRLLLVLLLVAGCAADGPGAGAGDVVGLDLAAEVRVDAVADADVPIDLAPDFVADEDGLADLAANSDSVAETDSGGDSGVEPDADVDAVGDADSVLDADAEVVADAAPDAIPDAVPDGDTAADAAPDAVPDAAPDATPDVVTPAVARAVIAGDSWSVGLVLPTIDAFAALGLNTVLTWETTAQSGSRALEWASNKDSKLDLLKAALDADPPAEVLLLVIGGNDLLSKMNDGWAKQPKLLRDLALDVIRNDVQTIADYALAKRPHLTVVIIGYDYLHYDFLKLAVSLPGMDQESFSQAFVDLEKRKLEIAQSTARVEYAHNFGWLQWQFGDKVHPPFLLPPLDYAAGVVPKPGVAPAYLPFPGGFKELPGPLDYLPDGLHPSLEGFRAIIDHSLSQGLESVMRGGPWAPTPPL